MQDKRSLCVAANKQNVERLLGKYLDEHPEVVKGYSPTDYDVKVIGRALGK